MTWLQGRVVSFHLSTNGKQALTGTFEKESVLALVEVVDDLGAWIVTNRPVSGMPRTLKLLKWEYFSTAVLEVEPYQEAPVSRIGFSV